MPKAKPPLVRLSEMTAGQAGDFFALLAERQIWKPSERIEPLGFLL
jgi:hypothetical protein